MKARGSRLQVLALVAMAGACAPSRTASEVALRALEERRAVEVIAQALRDGGGEPQPAREVVLPDGKKLRVEVTIAEGTYGIAYLDGEEARQLERSLPARNPNDDQLPVARSRDGTVVLVLYDDAYRYDVSEEHSATVVAAERKLARDVSDFVQHVVKRGKMR